MHKKYKYKKQKSIIHLGDFLLQDNWLKVKLISYFITD